MKDSENHIWQSVQRYQERWKPLKKLGAGGQGQGYQAERIFGGKSATGFLKELKDQSNPERRARMFREAAALATYNHPRIPKLIESNAHLYAERENKLFLVTEFIEGDTLAKRKGKPMSFDDAVELVDQLADIVCYLQANDAVHRDIKPDNIILRGCAVDAVLVDFGLTFSPVENGHFRTGDWEELGNRFLRLPELASNSGMKQDARSDVAFLTGILFFALFGEMPAVLEDAEGNLPHQRAKFDVFAVSPDSSRARLLAGLFDRGFQPRLADRFPNASSFREALAQLRKGPVNDINSNELIYELRSRASTERSQRQRRRAEGLREAWKWVEAVIRDLSREIDNEFAATFSGEYDPSTDHPYRNMGLHHHYRQHLSRYWLKTTCRFVGSELIVAVAEEDGTNEVEVLRTDAEAPKFQHGDKERIRQRLLNGIIALPLV